MRDQRPITIASTTAIGAKYIHIIAELVPNPLPKNVVSRIIVITSLLGEMKKSTIVYTMFVMINGVRSGKVIIQKFSHEVLAFDL